MKSILPHFRSEGRQLNQKEETCWRCEDLVQGACAPTFFRARSCARSDGPGSSACRGLVPDAPAGAGGAHDRHEAVAVHGKVGDPGEPLPFPLHAVGRVVRAAVVPRDAFPFDDRLPVSGDAGPDAGMGGAGRRAVRWRSSCRVPSASVNRAARCRCGCRGWRTAARGRRVSRRGRSGGRAAAGGRCGVRWTRGRPAGRWPSGADAPAGGRRRNVPRRCARSRSSCPRRSWRSAPGPVHRIVDPAEAFRKRPDRPGPAKVLPEPHRPNSRHRGQHRLR